MKKTMLFSILLMQLSFGKAQTYHPFPDSNAIWSEVIRDHSFFYYNRYGMIGDTNINSLQYYKIYSLRDSILSIYGSTYYGALREDSKKIYFIYRDCGQEILLYDFTKQAGDTIYSLFSDFEIYFCSPSTPNQSEITSIDSVLINGSYRKVFHLWLNDVDWIEGIGSTKGLFNPIEPQYTGMYNDWNLICFKQNEEILYLNPNYITCYPDFTGVVENKDAFKVNIYPITFTTNLTLQLPEVLPDINLSIYDVYSRLVCTTTATNTNRITLQNNHLPGGVYFYRITSKNNIINTGKVIKN